MLELCYIRYQAFGLSADLLNFGDDAYGSGKSDGLLEHRSSLEMKMVVQGSNLTNGVLFENFPLVALVNIDLSGAMRLEDVVGLNTLVVLDGSSSVEFEIACMVFDMSHQLLELFPPLPPHSNMFHRFHILASEEGQGFIHGGDWYLQVQKGSIRFQFGTWHLLFQRDNVRMLFDPGGKTQFCQRYKPITLKLTLAWHMDKGLNNWLNV